MTSGVEALKPCPFGCDGERYRHESDFEIVAIVAIGCQKCGALGPSIDVDDEAPTEADWAKAAAAWNTRPQPEGVEEMVEMTYSTILLLNEAVLSRHGSLPELDAKALEAGRATLEVLARSRGIG